MKKIFITAAIFLVCFQTIAYCQAGADVTAGAISKLKTLLTDHIAEKAFLQFDRPYPYYVAGDVVYFKAYVTMGERHEPSTISGVLHVDLIDKNDALLKSISLQLINGTGWGDFALPDTLQKGAYRIRAYTQWMRNDKKPYFFDQFISVSSVNNVDRVAENTTQGLKPELQFFPEGGNLVIDVPSKVAFKAVGTNGMGINVTGVVVDNDHKEVAKINSAHLGMGTFNFIPEDGKTYKAMVTFGDGSQYSVNLPAAESKGLALFVNTDDPSKVSIEIRANRAYYKENTNKPLNLLVYYAGTLKRYTPKLESEVLGLDIPANTLPTGIIQVTLLSGTGEPLNERLAFVQNPDLLNLSVTANKQSFAPRENVQLNFNAKDKNGMPVTGSFSVSVVDESKISVDETAENSILSYFLLSSDLKGYIEKPNFYFTNINKETRADLDMLMLTQGYRRFSWKELENDNSAATANAYTPENGIDISGTLKTKSGEPIANCVITLIPQAGGGVQIDTTNSQGKFRFANVSATKSVLKVISPVGKKGLLVFDKPVMEPAIESRNPAEAKFDANADILASLQSSQKQGIITASNEPANQLKPVNVVGKKDNYRSSNLGGAGHADQVVLGDAVKNATSLSFGLNGLLRGVIFSSGGIPALNTGMSISAGGQGIEPMLVVIDGTNVGIGQSVDIVNPGSVEAVEVLKGANAAIYGSQGGQGVIVITTKQGGGREQVVSTEMSPGIFAIEPKGFYKAREFYSPVYTAQNAGGSSDQRTTIFWKPDVSTDTGGNASFNFFNADGKGTYRVEVEGFDSKGNLGMQVFRYKVE